MRGSFLLTPLVTVQPLAFQPPAPSPGHKVSHGFFVGWVERSETHPRTLGVGGKTLTPCGRALPVRANAKDPATRAHPQRPTCSLTTASNKIGILQPISRSSRSHDPPVPSNQTLSSEHPGPPRSEAPASGTRSDQSPKPTASPWADDRFLLGCHSALSRLGC
jgi:hypothetical protein